MAVNPGQSLPAGRLHVDAYAATALVEDHLVLLDLRAGTYAVFDRVATMMWRELTREPQDRAVGELAELFDVDISVIERDLADFCGEQLAAGWLRAQSQAQANPPSRSAPRYRPSARRAWLERLGAERTLRAGFWAAYNATVGPLADDGAADESLEAVLRIFARAENFYVSGRAPLDCLPRSLALTRFLRCTGWPAAHVLGVRLYPFEAHAWVEVGGTPVNERGDIGDI